MERVALLSDKPRVDVDALGLSDAPSLRDTSRSDVPTLRDTVHATEREQLLAALSETDWVVTHAAARLGIPASTLRYRMKKHGLGVDAPTGPSPSTADLSRSPSEPTVPARWSAGVRWTDRWLAMLRAVLVAPAATASPNTARMLATLAQNAQSFGGRVEELSWSAMGAAFGLEPVED